MSTRVGLSAAAASVLVLLAGAGVPWSFRVTVAVLVGLLVAGGQHWHLPEATGAGLLGLVIIVGAGPARVAPWPVLLVWVVATWAVVLAAAGPRPLRAEPVDRSTRLRLVAGEVAVAAAALPLVAVVAGATPVVATWAAASGVAVVGLLVVALRPR